MKQVKVNNGQIWEVDGQRMNGEIFPADMVATGDRFFHIIHEGKSYEVEVLDRDAEKKSMRLRVNNGVYDITSKNEMDLMLEKMGLGGTASGKLKNMKAPMPGLVLDIRVEQGASVQKGDPLIVLEAMKMENVLKAEGEGVVKSILVKKGQNVDKGHVMLDFE